MIVAGSNRTTSAAWPSAKRPRVREAERRRGAAGHLGDRLGQGEQAEIAGIVADEPRERAVETRMRLALAGDDIGRHARPVGADQGGRGGGNGAHVGFRHRPHHDAGGPLVGDDDVADRVEQIAAPLARDLLDGSAGLTNSTTAERSVVSRDVGRAALPSSPGNPRIEAEVQPR
jgi:hypothetical protein